VWREFLLWSGAGRILQAFEHRFQKLKDIWRASCQRIHITELVMAQICQVCGKGPQFGNNISHAHNISRRRWNVNLRPVKAKTVGGAKRIRVCTRCIKAGKVVKA
jgi:large subunit ribosomal protein L28